MATDTTSEPIESWQARRQHIEHELGNWSRLSLRERSVSKELHDLLFAPISYNVTDELSIEEIQNDYALRRAAYYLIVERSFIDKNDNNNILVPSYKIAAWFGPDAIGNYVNNRFNALAKIEMIRNKLFPSMEIVNHVLGRPRAIRASSLQVYRDMYASDKSTEGRMLLSSGRLYNRELDHAIRVSIQRSRGPAKQDTDDINTVIAQLHEPMLQYLNTIPLFHFTRQITPEKIERAREVIADSVVIDDNEKEDQLQKLRAIQDMPKPFYTSGNILSTSRILTSGTTLCTIAREARRVLCYGWHELDIKACYIAISAKLYSMPFLNDKDINDEGVYSRVSRELGIEEKYESLCHDMIKQCVLAFLNGTTPCKANRQLNNALYDLRLPIMKCDTHQSTTLMEVYHRIRTIKLGIRERGYTEVVDTAGVSMHIPLRDREIKRDSKYRRKGDKVIDRSDTAVNTHLSAIYSFYELQLTIPLFITSQESCDFRIMTYDNDGITVKLRQEDRLGQIVKRLNKALLPTIRYYRFITYVTAKT